MKKILILIKLHLYIRQYDHNHITYFSYRNLDIRDAILQLLNVIRDGSKAVDRHDRTSKDTTTKMLKALEEMARNGINGKSFEKKIDNISTFLLRFLLYYPFVLQKHVQFLSKYFFYLFGIKFYQRTCLHNL